MKWQMLTLVGEDRPGIVAAITQALFEARCNLGEASMIRLGGNFTIMLMVSGGTAELEAVIKPVAQRLGCRYHLDDIEGQLHHHLAPNYQVRVCGADRAGIVAQVTGALAEAGFNILALESDVVGDDAQPVYIMTIQGFAAKDLETLQHRVDAIDQPDIDVKISAIETLIG